MKKWFYFLSFLVLFSNFSCENFDEKIIDEDDDVLIDPIEEINNQPKKIKLLSLGDSYTIGESVCEKCRFPEQLKDSLIPYIDKDTLSLQVIARTGWTTSDLIDNIENKNITSDFNLVTLLIGVNNQYQGFDFSVYEKQFPTLVATSIRAANNDKSNLIVVSIPDYAFTPFGNGDSRVSKEIDNYNAFAENYCKQNEITFVNITDITRQGFVNTDLVASDDLHPSKLAYTMFVERILPFAIEKIKD